MMNENKVVFTSIYLKSLVYDWFKPILINFLKNALDDQKKDIIMMFTS
jgi:hypothetical protein